MTNVVNIITLIIGLEREGSINSSMLYQHNYVQIMIDWGRQSKGETHTVNTHIYYFSYATRVPDFCQYPMTKLTLNNWQSRTSINNTSSYYQITSRNCSHQIQALLQKIDKGIWNQTTATIWHSFWAENHDCLNISSVPIYQIRWQSKISQHSDGIWPGQPTLMIAVLKGYFHIIGPPRCEGLVLNCCDDNNKAICIWIWKGNNSQQKRPVRQEAFLCHDVTVCDRFR